jgi:hypothetical protein
MELRAVLWLLVLALLTVEARPQATNAPGTLGGNIARLRFLPALPGEAEPKVYGEKPRYEPSLQLVYANTATGDKVLVVQLRPHKASGYTEIPAGRGKLEIREISPQDPKARGKLRASLALDTKAGLFYTAVLVKDGQGTRMEFWEDPPARRPAEKDQPAPEPERSLRCFVLVPGTEVEVTSMEAGLQVKAAFGKPGKSSKLKSGIWNVETKVLQAGSPVISSVELDLTEPGNWSLFFVRDIYGKIRPTLRQDAVAE